MLNTKICSKCKINKPLYEFSLGKNKDGYKSWCKECVNLYSRKYYEKNKEKISESHNKYYSTHKEEAAKRQRTYIANDKEKFYQRHKIYNMNNREKVTKQSRIYVMKNKEKIQKYWNEYAKERRKNIPKLDISMRMSRSMNLSLTKGKNGYHWETLVNYTLQDLMLHLEYMFKDGMSWLNRNEWHIDHIIPISLWEFSSYNDREFKQCFALCNLQPLWAIDNRKKFNKILIDKTT
jgi:hypothetical protein